MANNSVIQFALLIKQQIELHKKIQEYMFKIEAQSAFTMDEHFLAYDFTTMHAYLWTLSDLIRDMNHYQEQAFECSDRLEYCVGECFPDIDFERQSSDKPKEAT